VAAIAADFLAVEAEAPWSARARGAYLRDTHPGMPLAVSPSMNTAPVIQTSIQSTVGPSAAAGADNAANAGGAPSSFAGALTAAGAKPGRRSAAAKQSDDGASGGRLPPAGNQSPPIPVPRASATAMATPHSNGGSAADRPRMGRSRASGSVPAENPSAVQAAAGAAAMISGAESLSGPTRYVADGNATAAGAAAMISGAESLSGPIRHATDGNAATAGPAGAINRAVSGEVHTGTNDAVGVAADAAVAFGAMGGQPAMGARIESGLAAKFAAAAGASAPVAADADAAPKPTAATPIAPLQSNPALTSGAVATPVSTPSDPSAITASAPATAAVPVVPTGNAAPAAAASAKPLAAALRPVSRALGRTTAPATESGRAPADGGEADSVFSKVSGSSGAPSLASSSAKAPAPTILGGGSQDAAPTAAAAAAAAAGTSQPANTGKVAGDDSYDSDAYAGVGSAQPGGSGMRAAAGSLVAPDAANAPVVAAAGAHAPAGFDLAALTGGGDAAAGLSQLNANAAVGAFADATPTPALRIHASVDSADFSQGLSDRVSWMVDNDVNGAKLQVNPPQLGPIELRISVQGDRAQVWMVTHSAVARDALESSSPKLREMLNAQGFGQVSVDISQRSFQDRSAYTPPYQRESAAVGGATVTPAAPTIAASAPRSLQGALDAYA
jgi:flagellar hook-length control protein FliK